MTRKDKQGKTQNSIMYSKNAQRREWLCVICGIQYRKVMLVCVCVCVLRCIIYRERETMPSDAIRPPSRYVLQQQTTVLSSFCRLSNEKKTTPSGPK